MLAWIVNLGFQGNSVADVPTVPSAAQARQSAKISPTAWSSRWRAVGWIRLRPAWGL